MFLLIDPIHIKNIYLKMKKIDNSFMKKELNTIRYMQEIRQCSKEYLPMSDSLIAYDLILYIAITHNEQQPITIKQLFSCCSHSYTAIRTHYNRLLNNGYLIHKTAANDKRVKYVEPTEKLIQSTINFANKVSLILEISAGM